MGFLNRLFGKTPAPAGGRLGKDRASVEMSLYPGNATLEVVGESHYQDRLWKIVGGRRGDEVRYETHAVLMPESEDSEYPEAIRVLIEGNVVGSLSRFDAPLYRSGLSRLIGSTNRVVALNATIRGGGEFENLGGYFHHDPADFDLTPQKAHQLAAQSGLVHNFRTGFSEASATDPEDDRYDFSWVRELLGNESTAVKKLRTMLETERDPIDRHYMMCELEQRLYRGRDAFTSALDEYDSVCHQHDEEIHTIRPALLEKFGVIPVIDMYRQEAIRWQKAKDWERSRDWAERGIRVYGDDAARPEVVDDLHKRLEHATAMIELANRPKAMKPTRAVAPATKATDSGIETLVCAECGTTFGTSPKERAQTSLLPNLPRHPCPPARSRRVRHPRWAAV